MKRQRPFFDYLYGDGCKITPGKRIWPKGGRLWVSLPPVSSSRRTGTRNGIIFGLLNLLRRETTLSVPNLAFSTSRALRGGLNDYFFGLKREKSGRCLAILWLLSLLISSQQQTPRLFVQSRTNTGKKETVRKKPWGSVKWGK